MAVARVRVHTGDRHTAGLVRHIRHCEGRVAFWVPEIGPFVPREQVPYLMAGARVGIRTHASHTSHASTRGRIGHEGRGGGQDALGMEELRMHVEHQEG